MVIVHFQSSENFSKVAKKLFNKHKKIVLKILPNAQIRHIGSTAIPGAITKGDLDIQTRIPKEDFSKAISKLKKIYKVNQYRNWTRTFASFKDEESEKIPIGVQLTVIDSEEDKLFKNQQKLLVSSPDILKKYNEMKLKFEGKSLKNYRTARAKFFDKIKKSLE